MVSAHDEDASKQEILESIERFDEGVAFLLNGGPLKGGGGKYVSHEAQRQLRIASCVVFARGIHSAQRHLELRGNHQAVLGLEAAGLYTGN